MTFDVPPVGPVSASPWSRPRAGAGSPAPAPDRVEAPADRVEIDPLLVPGEPPREVREAVREAARVLDELHERGRELRFAHDGDGALVVEVRDRDGLLLRRIPATEALALVTREATLDDATGALTWPG